MSGDWSTPQMTARANARETARMAAKARQRVVEDLERLAADAGISQQVLGAAAGVSQGFVSRILAGKTSPSMATLARLAVPLGADLSIRLYPNTGPTIRDRHQARILEAVLELLGSSWRAHTEVNVWKPVRGAIDAVLHHSRAGLVVATEIESDLRRIEQTIRWSREKADALASWSEWPRLLGPGGEAPRVAQLLLVRRTRANQRAAREFARQLAIPYPAHPEDALAALAGDRPWAGSALVWARIDVDRVRLLPTR
jgi:transcriptional regulator with XRE-family HTH domain